MSSNDLVYQFDQSLTVSLGRLSSHLLIGDHCLEDTLCLPFHRPLFQIVDYSKMVDYLWFSIGLYFSNLAGLFAFAFDDEERIVHNTLLPQKLDIANECIPEFGGL
jgi:hypothetical protein